MGVLGEQILHHGVGEAGGGGAREGGLHRINARLGQHPRRLPVLQHAAGN